MASRHMDIAAAMGPSDAPRHSGFGNRAMTVRHDGNGDLASSLFRQHYLPLVRHLSRRLGGNHSVAEDVAQEAITRIAAAARDYDPVGAKGLLYRVADNLVIDHFRSENTRRVTLAQLTLIGSAQNQPSVQRAAIAREELRLVREAILALPDRCRMVYVLHRFEDMTYPQIAAHCGISVSMVEKHMNKALLRLAASLDRPRSGG